MNVFTSRILPESGLQLLQAAGLQVTQHTEKREIPQDELIHICRQHDAFISIGHNNINEHFLKECRHLKAISLLSAGYDNVDVDAANRLGIAIGHTPGVLSQATADVAFLLMIAVSRNAFYMNRQITAGNWGFYEPTANLGIELYGKTLGIFGLGRIGIELARKCIAAYKMNIIYHNRSSNLAAEQELGARKVSFDELLQQSDVLSLHANLSPAALGLFNRAAFSQMKPTSIFINTARGRMHNEEDLIEALNQGTIWGAGLDVTNPEPMASDNPLLTMKNVCVLPHIGSATIETRNAMAKIAAENILAAIEGKRMPHAINPEVYLA